MDQRKQVKHRPDDAPDADSQWGFRQGKLRGVYPAKMTLMLRDEYVDLTFVHGTYNLDHVRGYPRHLHLYPRGEESSVKWVHANFTCNAWIDPLHWAQVCRTMIVDPLGGPLDAAPGRCGSVSPPRGSRFLLGAPPPASAGISAQEGVCSPQEGSSSRQSPTAVSLSRHRGS
jgi:hypothetical protein